MKQDKIITFEIPISGWYGHFKIRKNGSSYITIDGITYRGHYI